MYQRVSQANELLPGAEVVRVVSPRKLYLTLEGLEVYTRYQISILAFTVKGDGVVSEAVIAGMSNDCMNAMLHFI